MRPVLVVTKSALPATLPRATAVVTLAAAEEPSLLLRLRSGVVDLLLETLVMLPLLGTAKVTVRVTL